MARPDRLRRDADDISNLDDLIEARKGQDSDFAGDVRTPGQDVVLPEDTDVEEALTFPHPKHNHEAPIDLMDTPHEADIDPDQQAWAERNFLPSDYSHGYNEATTTDPSDDPDAAAAERIHELRDVHSEEITEEPEIEIMGRRFEGEEGAE